jgi:hypothetical protein
LSDRVGQPGDVLFAQIGGGHSSTEYGNGGSLILWLVSQLVP